MHLSLQPWNALNPHLPGSVEHGQYTPLNAMPKQQADNFKQLPTLCIL